MGSLVDLTTQIFGWLKITGRAEPPTGTTHRLAWFSCTCRCGKVVIVRSDDLRMMKRRKCGPDCPYVVPKPRATITTIDPRGGQDVDFAN